MFLLVLFSCPHVPAGYFLCFTYLLTMSILISSTHHVVLIIFLFFPLPLPLPPSQWSLLNNDEKDSRAQGSRVWRPRNLTPGLATTSIPVCPWVVAKPLWSLGSSLSAASSLHLCSAAGIEEIFT